MRAHLEYAHRLWEDILRPGDAVIDATCGNGKDTLKLARTVLTAANGLVIGLDIQQIALDRTRSLLEQHLNTEQLKRTHLFLQSHAEFPPIAYHHPIRLIVYNLGYLPGGDKSLTTATTTTLTSFRRAMHIIAPGGTLCFTCYPGHAEGAKEQSALTHAVLKLDPQQWAVTRPASNDTRPISPNLLLIKKLT